MAVYKGNERIADVNRNLDTMCVLNKLTVNGDVAVYNGMINVTQLDIRNWLLLPSTPPAVRQPGMIWVENT